MNRYITTQVENLASTFIIAHKWETPDGFHQQNIKEDSAKYKLIQTNNRSGNSATNNMKQNPKKEKETKHKKLDRKKKKKT